MVVRCTLKLKFYDFLVNFYRLAKLEKDFSSFSKTVGRKWLQPVINRGRKKRYDLCHDYLVQYIVILTQWRTIGNQRIL